MKVLVLYDYPPSPGGLATQGDLLRQGLEKIGVETRPAPFEGAQEKEWYYRWFRPDVVVGIGWWGHTPDIVLHPMRFGLPAVPWLVADGFIANYHEVLGSLPLLFATSQWVKKTYARDGVSVENMKVVPIGCDTDAFRPIPRDDPRVRAVRESLGVGPDEKVILTIGGDAASKGAQEVMQALALITKECPDWTYVCKVWPQPRTSRQLRQDVQIARQLGIADRVVFASGQFSRNFVPYLMNACDIYAAPSRLEGYGMPMIEAQACGKPVISVAAMGMLDTIKHGHTGLLAGVAQEITISGAKLTPDMGYKRSRNVAFPEPKKVAIRADVNDLATYLKRLLTEDDTCKNMGDEGRRNVQENFHYIQVAERVANELADAFDLSVP
ncbi:MAG: glycosyltransferase family 4 protein [Planctomycetota bacterium]